MADRATGATFGVAVYPDDGLDVDALLKAADADMYRRKPIG
jgi:GGDEF domain-containing protein